MRNVRLLLTFAVIALLIGASLSVRAQGPGPAPAGLFPDSPPYALHGSFWVGTTDFVIGAGTERPVEVTVWYPATNLDQVAEETTYTYHPLATGATTVKGHAIADGAPDWSKGPYPLVIASHGASDTRFFATYLTEHLASYGFVVMAASHRGDTSGDTVYPSQGYIDGIANAMVYRPQDVQGQMDLAKKLTAKDGRLPGLIDMEHIAVIGHSYGGYTALAAAGAQVDLSGVRSWCSSVANDPAVTSSWGYLFTCTSIVANEEKEIKLLGAQVKPSELWPSFNISGVDAIVPMAPFAMPYSDKSLTNVKVPTLVIVGTADSLYDNNKWLYEALPSPNKSFFVFQNMGHNPISQGCDDLQKRQSYFACFGEQVWNPDRVHDRIRQITTAFLLDVLKGDKDAHKALLPDAVKFPGIEYKTTMK